MLGLALFTTLAIVAAAIQWIERRQATPKKDEPKAGERKGPVLVKAHYRKAPPPRYPRMAFQARLVERPARSRVTVDVYGHSSEDVPLLALFTAVRQDPT